MRIKFEDTSQVLRVLVKRMLVVMKILAGEVGRK